MLDFIDTKFFGAASTGLGALATSCVAGASEWHLFILPAVVMIAYYLIFAEIRELERGRRW